MARTSSNKYSDTTITEDNYSSNSGGNVVSVAGKAGAVTLDLSDVSDSATRVALTKVAQTILGAKTFDSEIVGVGAKLWRPIGTTIIADFSISVSSHGSLYSLIDSDAESIEIDVPDGHGFTIGQEAEFIHILGANTITFVPSGSQTILSKDSNLQITGIGSAVLLKYIAVNTWHLIGDLS